jgi:hypothetical protein
MVIGMCDCKANNNPAESKESANSLTHTCARISSHQPGRRPWHLERVSRGTRTKKLILEAEVLEINDKVSILAMGRANESQSGRHHVHTESPVHADQVA